MARACCASKLIFVNIPISELSAGLNLEGKPSLLTYFLHAAYEKLFFLQSLTVESLSFCCIKRIPHLIFFNFFSYI
eukprot:g19730.t1